MVKQLSELLPAPDQLQHGKALVMPSELPVPSSRPDWQPPTLHQVATTTAVDRLFDLLPPQDVGDPKTFLAATVALFQQYPAEVVDKALFEIPLRSDRPTLKLMREVLEDIYAPIERALERQRAQENFQRLRLPPRAPRTAEEQAKVDAQVAEVRRLFPPQPKPLYRGNAIDHGDGKHHQRVLAELARKQRRTPMRA